MSNDWVTLRKDFHKWLQEEAKTDSKLDSEEIEKIGDKKAVLEYSNKFQEFLKTQKDSEENFTKNTIDLNDEDNENFLDEIFSDYTSGLKKDSKEFKAIDSDSDGKISSKEKKNFFNSIKNLDKNDKDITFSDFSKAIEKFDDGDYDFINSSTKKSDSSNASGGAQSSSSASSGGTSGVSGTSGSYLSGEVASNNPLEEVSMETVYSTEETEYEEIAIDLSKATSIEEIDTQIEIAEDNKAQAQLTFAQIGEEYLASKDSYEAERENYNNSLAELATSNENIKNYQDQISTNEGLLNQEITNLNGLELARNTTNNALTAANEELNGLSLPEPPRSEEAAEEQIYTNAMTEYNKQKAALEEKIKTLEEQLQKDIQAIEEKEEKIAEIQETIAQNCINLEEEIVNNQNIDDSTKEYLLSMNTLTAYMNLYEATMATAYADVNNADTQIAFLEAKKASLGETS